ncbi:general substrate transporter [Ilyonectria sp. MPI-CAGE-AT-0026]|nr:general substrate transporter [Ilyonectria sp. MPI-CAGE-AT-0026]
MEKSPTSVSHVSDIEITERLPDPKEVKNWRVYLYCIGVCFGAVALGYDVSVMGGTLILPSFERDFGLLDLDQKQLDDITSNIVSCFQAGMFFGALASHPISERWGRKWCMFLGILVFLMGASMQTGSSGIVALVMAGRCIAGLGIGATAPVIPVYIAEVAPPSIRGKLVGFFEIGSQGAQMLGFWVNYAANKTLDPESSTQWMVPLGLQLLPGTVLIGILPFCPESPRWLCRKDNWEKAENIMVDIRQLPITHPYLARELREIRAEVEFEAHLAVLNPGFRGQVKDLFRKGIRNRVAIGLCLMMCQNMTGVNIITYYSPRIFATLGIQSTDLKLFATGFYGLAKTLGMVIFSFWVADHLGRRKGLIWGAFVGAVPMLYLGGYVMKNDPEAVAAAGKTNMSGWGYLAMVCVYLYGVIYCATWQGITWLYCSEIYPLYIRSLCVALTIADERAWSYVVSRSTPYMISDIGYGTYFFYGALMVCMGFWAWWCIRETNGIPIEEMDILFVHMQLGNAC